MIDPEKRVDMISTNGGRDMLQEIQEKKGDREQEGDTRNGLKKA